MADDHDVADELINGLRLGESMPDCFNNALRRMIADHGAQRAVLWLPSMGQVVAIAEACDDNEAPSTIGTIVAPNQFVRIVLDIVTDANIWPEFAEQSEIGIVFFELNDVRPKWAPLAASSRFKSQAIAELRSRCKTVGYLNLDFSESKAWSDADSTALRSSLAILSVIMDLSDQISAANERAAAFDAAFQIASMTLANDPECLDKAGAIVAKQLNFARFDIFVPDKDSLTLVGVKGRTVDLSSRDDHPAACFLEREPRLTGCGTKSDTDDTSREVIEICVALSVEDKTLGVLVLEDTSEEWSYIRIYSDQRLRYLTDVLAGTLARLSPHADASCSA